jgi:hypothetical protein
MNTKQLKSSSFPKMLSDLANLNQFMKIFSLLSLSLVFASFLVIFYLTHQEPLILTFNSDGKNLDKMAMPKAEDLIKEGVIRYLEKRYTWMPSDVQKRLKESSFFVSPTSQKAFSEALANIIRFSLEKQVAQKVYPANIEINMKDGTALITGDRVTSIQGLKAAGNLKLQLTFESGQRTKENPWGIYITKEKEEQ